MRMMITALLLATAAPLAAQQAAPGVTQRVDRLEKEMRAVQRKVFPGGAGATLEPEISAAPPTAAGVPASAPIVDLTARVNALEQELQRMTGQVEQNGFKLRMLEEQLTRLKSDSDARIAALESRGVAAAPAAAEPGFAPAPAPAATRPTRPAPAPATEPEPAPPTPAPAPAAAGRTPTGDGGEDAYLAGYDLWVAKRYDEAATALATVATKYPKHRRASFAENLRGRALLDAGQPARAAQVFLGNYQNRPKGERAPESLYYLGQALMSLKPPKPGDACKAYAELSDTYGATIEAGLADRLAKAKAAAKCGG